MKPKRKAAYYLRAAMIASAVLLPAVSLVPLGSIWLWEKGYLLYWVGAALALSLSSFLVQLWLVRRSDVVSLGDERQGPSSSAEPSWTPRESEAWTAVEALAAEADPSKLTGRDAIVDLGLLTIETVARRFHPDVEDPLWRFTAPEALTLVERVSRELRPFVVENIPLGDQLTMAQVLKIYRWRSVIDVAEKAYDVWRIIRLLNPLAAVANEARAPVEGVVGYSKGAIGWHPAKVTISPLGRRMRSIGRVPARPTWNANSWPLASRTPMKPSASSITENPPSPL